MKTQGILVTGGTGWIGRALLARLAVSHGSKVWAPSRADLDLEKEWHALAPPFPIDTIVHLAASRRRNEAGPERYPEEVRINLDATARLYEWARAQSVRAIVHVSTISVLEPSADLSERIDEDAPLVTPPSHPYALSKRWGEELADALRGTFESVAVVRPGLLYGSDPPGRSTIAKMVTAAIGGEPRPIAAPDGNLFAPVHIDDVVDVLARLAAAPRDITVNVVGPDAVLERTMLENLAAQFGTEPAFEVVDDAEPVALAPSTELVDELFPNRLCTPWLPGIAHAFPR